jgi:O-acetyl-ADP-ribose deacetylase (regulator of RNase III)
MSQTIMRRTLLSGKTLSILQGDITEQAVDAIVNAANPQLIHGGGVAGAIARRGGPLIQAQSDRWVREHGPLSHDQVAITDAGELPCRYVIHAVGPKWGEGDEDAKLHASITSVLDTASEREFASLALPAISTGIFGFPKARAAKILLETTMAFLADHPHSSLQEIRFVLFDQPTLQAFVDAFARHLPQSANHS